jgi:hypothetical protein
MYLSIGLTAVLSIIKACVLTVHCGLSECGMRKRGKLSRVFSEASTTTMLGDVPHQAGVNERLNC